jgi:hypothetical protein
VCEERKRGLSQRREEGGHQGARTAHGLEKTGLVNERNLDDCLPLLLLAVHVGFKLQRIKVEDGRIGIVHEILQKEGKPEMLERHLNKLEFK